NLPRRLSPFVILHHTGRTSGRSYNVPLAAFARGSDVVLTPTYGPNADWVRNVIASGHFVLDRRGTKLSYEEARLVSREEAWPLLPWAVRVAMRVLGIRHFVAARRSIVADGQRLNSDLL
ncbi:MAG: nitroreductase family deazaflavin-dependent oxidoreductase, partial [Acidimicrobiia bacterium]|nr:nitroreductase family deazaflavin-dependent oxidoreductase [Acidimicrobiia bacterium]